MSSYKIAWLPGDGVGVEVMEAARICLDALKFDARYSHGDIGWEFWRTEGESFPNGRSTFSRLATPRCSAPSPRSRRKTPRRSWCPSSRERA